MSLLLVSVPYSETKQAAVPLYIVTAILCFAVYFIFKPSAMKKHALIGLYAYFSSLFASAIYLSVIHSPHMRATILIGVFCIVPVSLLDRPLRLNSFVFFWLLIHTIFAFRLKPQYALDDTVNILLFAILGCYIGNKMIWIHLDNYEAQRQLTVEKETDVLTGIFNRRKLFETLALLETTHSRKPSAVFMIDIDHFKDFNDSYGHAAGDDYLRRCGEVFRKFSEDYDLNFYRYGGEEFVALAYGYTEKELLYIAEELRLTVENTDYKGHGMTVSIGVAYSGDEEVRNYEHVIDQADQAAYEAKHRGRNQIRFTHYDARQQDTLAVSHKHA